VSRLRAPRHPPAITPRTVGQFNAAALRATRLPPMLAPHRGAAPPAFGSSVIGYTLSSPLADGPEYSLVLERSDHDLTRLTRLFPIALSVFFFFFCL